MNADQIRLLKETHMAESTNASGNKTTLGAYMRFCLDGGIDFVTSKDFVIFDDANNMLHCIAINEDGNSQANYPLKVISTDYSIVQQVECVYSLTNFISMLDSELLSSISEEKKLKLKDWANSIRNQAIQPSRATPYFVSNPMVIPAPATIEPRIDGITHAIIDNGLGDINNSNKEDIPTEDIVDENLIEENSMNSTDDAGIIENTDSSDEGAETNKENDAPESNDLEDDIKVPTGEEDTN